jgi:hypothetical protein
MRWILDTTIDLTQICEDAAWIFATVVADLIALGITAGDADAFAYHVFSVHANGPGYDPARKLTEDQWDRLKYD